MDKIIIIGAGGFSSEIIWVINKMNETGRSRWKVIGIFDDNPTHIGKMIEGIEVLGTTNDAFNIFPERSYFHCAVGKNEDRAFLCKKFESKGFIPATLIHPTVVTGPNSKIGKGVFIGALSIIGPHAQIDNYVLINTHAGIGHHSVIADYSQICPGAYVNGYCKVNKMAFIGSNSSVQPGITIGDSSTIGANSFVHRSVKPGHTVIGVPARIIRKLK
tara:strand:- start:552 stop:1202 length:651 start_codon:yes stop_codon:yes gene_type:complete